MDRKPQEVNPSWLTPEVLIEFIDELRDAGYKIGVSQYIIVQDLILALIAQGDNLDRPQRFKSLLSPLLCHSPTEQEDFYQRFDQWLQRMGFIVSQTGQIDTKAEELQQELYNIKKQWRKWQQWSLVVILTVIAWLTLSLVLFQPRYSTQPQNANIQPPNSLLNWKSILGVLLLIAFLTFLVWGIWWFWRARQFLVRHATNQQPQLEQVSIPGLDEELFPKVLFLRIAQDLRRRIRVPSAELDINRTLEKSVQRGGWFTPVYSYRQVLPEYLVLIDRANYGDHQARFVEEMIDRLRLNEVFITGYYFDGDPRVCFPMTEKGSPCTLNEIATKYSEYRLIIFSDAQGLFSSRTGELERWSDLFSSWSDRAVLTPKPSENWGYQELELSQQFIVQPATPEGLMNLIRSIQSGKSPYEPSENIRAPFPEELRVRSRRWIQRDPPESLLIDEVLKTLHDYLGEAGYRWLSACAIFPQMHWNLTLYLGNTLKIEDGSTLLQASVLNDLARLPWFRHNYMPDWLRRRLISDIPRPQEQDIRSAIEALLIAAVQGSVGNLQLEIARSDSNVLSLLAQPLLRLLAKSASEDSLRDYIFQDFMTGIKQKQLAVRLPEALFVSFTQLFPIISTGKVLTRKAYLIPGMLTVVFIVLIFATVGYPQANLVIVATYIAFAAYYFVYQLCGKQKPWWVLLASGLTTTLILLSPLLDIFIFVFRGILPGNLPSAQDTPTFTELLVRYFFGAGLMEELLKALPVLGAFMIAKILPSPLRERVGVWEPLDGILLGTASAVGFTLLETLGQYVPSITQDASVQSGIAAGQLVGLQLLIPRILGSVAGHMAYSGCLGYFIGLAVLKPRRSWQILPIGYFSVSALHALWNAAGSINALLLVVVGVLSYAFLMAAIFKARVLSPTRSYVPK